MTKKRSTARRPRTDHQAVPPPPLAGSITDRQGQFRTLARAVRPERGSEQAFLASKLTMLRTHPGLRDSDRREGEEQLAQRFDAKMMRAASKRTIPTPGGVGYGMFYTTDFRNAFVRGTSLYYEIVCPTAPGGNVNTWLYLTATNRAAKGVEAFVSYQGQNDTRFKVFDWARSDQWQTNVAFGSLGAYLRNTVAHGVALQVLPVWNSTFEIGANLWRNEVLLHNRAANRWDLIYRFDYASTSAEQKSGWVGSWGEIVETFQSSYSGTNRLGFLNTMLIGRGSAGWGTWGVLTAAQSTIRNDGQGFSPQFLDPNYSFVVRS
jgi:hypothetical protein